VGRPDGRQARRRAAKTRGARWKPDGSFRDIGLLRAGRLRPSIRQRAYGGAKAGRFPRPVPVTVANNEHHYGTCTSSRSEAHEYPRDPSWRFPTESGSLKGIGRSDYTLTRRALFLFDPKRAVHKGGQETANGTTGERTIYLRAEGAAGSPLLFDPQRWRGSCELVSRRENGVDVIRYGASRSERTKNR